MSSQRRVAAVFHLDKAVSHEHKTFAGVERYARDRGGWQVIIDNFPHFDRHGRHRGRRIDGVIGRLWKNTARRIRSAGLPMVNTMLNDRAPGVPSVLHDAAGSGRLAAEHLLARGLRNFAYLGFPEDENSLRQEAAFAESIREAGCRHVAHWTHLLYGHDDPHWQRFQRNLDVWVSGWKTPIGVFVTHDLLCRHVASACIAQGLKVPFDVALVSSSNEPVICASEPTLSSIDYGFERIGYYAAELLDRLMDGEPAPPEPIFLPPLELVPRQSTDVVAADNPMVSRALRYIMDRSHRRLCVSDVARHVGTSRWTLLRLFQRDLGRTVEHFIYELRHQRLRRILIESDEPLKVVARESGFRDEGELCRTFRRMEGMTPGDYRRRRVRH